MRKIPFNRACFEGKELAYIAEAITNGHISGDGPFTKKCHAFLKQNLGSEAVLLTTSCTHALEMSALLLDIKEDDEVIVPSFTFVSTVNAFVLRGAKPVFIDIREDTLNLDESLLAGLITPKTKAIVPVHYAGVGCEMDAIMDTANNHSIAVIEDNAHGLLGKYKDQKLGTFGCLATQSFHETKNFTCGEGGALLINSPRLVERAEIIREKGTNRSRFFRGQVDKYTWVDVGSSYLSSDMLAAFLYAQFELSEGIQAKRKRVWTRYFEGLVDWAAQSGVRLPFVPDYCEQPHHMFYLLMPSLDIRQKFIQYLASHNIQSVFHYLPLHLSEQGRELGGDKFQCPVTERVSDQLVRLPFYNDLSTEDQNRVIDCIRRFEA